MHTALLHPVLNPGTGIVFCFTIHLPAPRILAICIFKVTLKAYT